MIHDADIYLELGEDRYLVLSIHRDDEHGCTSLEVANGPKRYARLWDSQPEMEWGWQLNEAARLVWGEEHNTGKSSE